ncbi:hypothetical protein CBM2587_A230136 [Cupriavidus taiwanensis]|uniref:Uncharacterized protein n=1 Tax=Cupriavidus taiwanensis TaxID=164546 RepID=A0A976A1B6_9BURK|nr:hypothetical protein CBM2587_A230136 [Cupriavidus taiwanensis]
MSASQQVQQLRRCESETRRQKRPRIAP